jgi:hypothetical protein
MEKHYKPGERVTYSGVYKIVGVTRAHTIATRHVTQGSVFPPTPKPGQRYVLSSKVNALYTDVTSSANIDSTAIKYSETMKRLAKR